nr:collagen alpha-1(III) chain-like [Aegilops tauschii subsp. strangulata]
MGDSLGDSVGDAPTAVWQPAMAGKTGWSVVRRNASVLQVSGGEGRAGSPAVGDAGRHNRFWALAAEDSEEEDEGGELDPERGLCAAPAGPSIGDFVALAAKQGGVASRSGRGRRFAPGGRGSRSMASRIWLPPRECDSGSGAGGSSGAATCIRAKAAASLTVPQTELSREDWPRLTASPVAAAVEAAGAPCGPEPMRLAPGPRVGPGGPLVGAPPGMATSVGLEASPGPGPSGQSGAFSDPPVGLGLETTSDPRPHVTQRPNASRPDTGPITGYKWVRRGCLDPRLGFPATTREVRRFAHSARSIQICPLPPPSPVLRGGGDGR